MILARSTLQNCYKKSCPQKRCFFSTVYDNLSMKHPSSSDYGANAGAESTLMSSAWTVVYSLLLPSHWFPNNNKNNNNNNTIYFVVPFRTPKGFLIAVLCCFIIIKLLRAAFLLILWPHTVKKTKKTTTNISIAKTHCLVDFIKVDKLNFWG